PGAGAAVAPRAAEGLVAGQAHAGQRRRGRAVEQAAAVSGPTLAARAGCAAVAPRAALGSVAGQVHVGQGDDGVVSIHAPAARGAPAAAARTAAAAVASPAPVRLVADDVDGG